MAPEPVMLSSPCVPTRTTGSSKRHKPATQRGKTAKLRKKKLWQHFSPWDSNISIESEDKDLVYFCRSRGIIKTPTISLQPNRANTSNNLSTTGRDVKNNSRQSVLSAVTCQKDSSSLNKAISNATVAEDFRCGEQLCSYLKDKRRFVRESLGIEEKSTAADVHRESAEQKSLNKLSHSEKPNKLQFAPTLSSSVTTQETKSRAIDTILSEKLDSGDDEASPDSCESVIQTATLPQILISGVKNDLGDRSSKSASSSKHNSPPSSLSPGEQRRTPSLKKHAKEWGAEVETKIMKLYENSTPEVNYLTALDAKSHPSSIFKLRSNLESKYSSTEHTPSYVLALANLFRRRMQIRKEFSQAAGEFINNSIGSDESAPKSVADSFPQQLPKRAPHAIPSAVSIETPVSLRYHHVSTSASCKNACTTPIRSITAKATPITFCSISRPLSATLQQQSKAAVTVGTKPDCDAMKLKEKPDRSKTSNDQIKKLNSNNNPSKKETLETLLSVYPKQRQFKFAAVSSADEIFSTSPSEGHDEVIPIYAQDKHVGQREDFKHQESAEALIMSLAATLKKDRKLSLPAKLPIKQRQQPDKKKFKLLADFQKRNYRSAGLGVKLLAKNGKHTGSSRKFQKDQHQANEKHVSNMLSLESLHSADKAADFPRTPMCEVRWVGSLGTLYPKPKISSNPVLLSQCHDVKSQTVNSG